MKTVTTKAIAKVAAVATGLGMATSLLSLAPIAHADLTYSQTAALQAAGFTQAQINAISAVVGPASTSSSGSMSSSCSFTMDLHTGSSGMQVTCLQNALIGMGYSIPAGATGYFGSETKAAVAAWQAAYNVTPAAGYFGAISRRAWGMSAPMSTPMTGLPAGCTSTTGYSSQTGQSCATSSLPAGCTSTTGYSSQTGQSCASSTSTSTSTSNGSITTTGQEGSVDNFQIIGASSISMNAAGSNTAYGFSFQAGGSDLQMNRIDYDIYENTSTGSSPSTRPWNIFQTATLMDGSNTLATVDVSNPANWSQDGTVLNADPVNPTSVTIYRVRFDNLANLVKEGSTHNLYLTLSTQNNLSDSDVGGAGKSVTWDLYLPGLGMRAVDGAGIQQYSSSSNQQTTTVKVSNSTTGSVSVTIGTDTPPTQAVQASASTQTSDVKMMTFSMTASGADAYVYQIPMTVATTGTNAGSLVQDVKLYEGACTVGTLLKTYSFAAAPISNNFTFNNLSNVTIPSGTTQAFCVTADVSIVDGVTVTNGSSLGVNVGTAGSWDVENSGGSSITPTGSASGYVQSFFTNGVTLSSAPTTASWGNIATAGNGTLQTATYTFSFGVTAFGESIYVASTTSGLTSAVTATSTSATSLGAELLDQNGIGTTTAASAISCTNATVQSSGNYLIPSGQTATCSVTMTKQGQSGQVHGKLESLFFVPGADADWNAASSTSFSSSYLGAPQFLSD